MDEYLFIVMAKLKADRQRLAREQQHHGALSREQPTLTADRARKSASRSDDHGQWRAHS